MARRVFVAGATGAVGIPLCRLLIADGWQVVGSTRAASKEASLRALGVEPVVVDVFDAERLQAAVREARPDVVVHQLTDLPAALDPARLAEGLVRNARLRDIGTRNLVAAAAAAGVGRFVAQSIAFAYAPGPTPFTEDSPLHLGVPGAAAAASVRGVASLEAQVLAGPFEGVVLRYGRFYGPGTGFDAPNGPDPVHVDAAADAARRALTRGSRGIYNVAEAGGTVSSARAERDLGWRAEFRSGPEAR
jgi:nucleoside-diphosphate-sugar epimerase